MEIEKFRGDTRWYSRDGHFYVATRTRGMTTYMRCSSDRCSARWTLKNGNVASLVTGFHNHEPTPWIPNRNSMYQSLKRRATDSNQCLNGIYEEEAARYPDAAPHLLYESVAPSMRKWRRSTQPAVPRTLGDYGVALAEHPRYNDMLLATVVAGGATAVILAMRGFGECLRDSSTVIVDGTFLTVPAGLPAYQLLTMHSIIENGFFHPIMVLMQNRQRSLYEAVLARIWQAATNPHPAYIVTDYEPALQTALTTVTGVQAQGCLFHFVQALLRRARQEGIRVGRNSRGWRLVQLYATLALLPAEQVPLGLAEVRGIAEEEALPFNNVFHDYFERQWMARVGPHNFSVHGRPHQTSNVAESFHASLRRSLGASPNIWRFTEVAAQKFSVSASRIEALRRGILQRRNRGRNYIRQNLLAANQRALERGLITLREFLVASSRQMEVGVEEVVADVPEIGNEVEIEMEREVVVLEDQGPLALDPQEPQLVDHFEALQAPSPPPHGDPLPQPQPQPQPPTLATLCNVCTDNVSTEVLIPCGHILCAPCRGHINACPFCRAHITNTVQFYFSQ